MTDPIYTSLAGRRCLVLDDEFLIALDVQDILERAGVAVISAANADDALKIINSEARFDLAVVDVKLGAATTSGIDVAAVLTERGTPFVFLTGMRGGDMRACYPGVPVVDKPYSADRLIAALRGLLAAP